MKSSFIKLSVAALVCATVGVVTLPSRAADTNTTATATKKVEATFTGTAKAVASKKNPDKKHLVLTAADGTDYTLISRHITPDDVEKYDGKQVTVSGTAKSHGTRHSIYVSKIEEAPAK